MKVWVFNCYGWCLGYMEAHKIKEWNETHLLLTEKITSWEE